MNVKEYLSQAIYLDRIINSKLEQVFVLRNLATKATVSLHGDRVNCTKVSSPMENAIIKLIDLEREINSDIDKWVDLKREMTVFISSIENLSCRLLLELRYISGKTWEDVAEIMGYDLRWIYRLHGKALQEAEKLSH